MNTSTVIDAIRMPEAFLPPADAVYEVSATPFQSTAIGMLFLDTAIKLNKARDVADSGETFGGEYTPESVEAAQEFLAIYGDPSALAIGTDAIARLAMPPSRLTMTDLAIIASICQVGAMLMPNTDDWAEFVASWLRGVRQQILDDHAVRSEVQS